MEWEDSVKQELEELQKQLGKKQKFEGVVSSLKSLLQHTYPPSSPSLRNSFYSVVCRVATVLKTRYTAPGFWSAEQALFFVSGPTEKVHLKACIAHARGHSHLEDNPSQASQRAWNHANRGASSQGLAANDTAPVDVANELQKLRNTFEEIRLRRLMVDGGPVASKAPPASKEIVAKLPVITLTKEVLANMGKDTECAICRENLVLNDKMQELPCKHTFHPPCLKPWLDEHNSCPICRYELQTDDHAYERWKEHEKEAEEERKAAENAIRAIAYMLLFGEYCS